MTRHGKLLTYNNGSRLLLHLPTVAWILFLPFPFGHLISHTDSLVYSLTCSFGALGRLWTLAFLPSTRSVSVTQVEKEPEFWCGFASLPKVLSSSISFPVSITLGFSDKSGKEACTLEHCPGSCALFDLELHDSLPVLGHVVLGQSTYLPSGRPGALSPQWKKNSQNPVMSTDESWLYFLNCLFSTWLKSLDFI